MGFDDLNDFTPIAAYRTGAITAERVREILEKTSADFREQRGITWALVLEGRLIGTCGYYRGFEDRWGEIGYVMHPAFRRQGYMEEALRAIIAFGFDKLGLDGIGAFTSEQNTASVALLEKLGFSRTGETVGDDRKFELAKVPFPGSQ